MPTFTGRVVLAMHARGEWWPHGVYALLRTVTTIIPSAPVAFQDATFTAGSPLQVETSSTPVVSRSTAAFPPARPAASHARTPQAPRPLQTLRKWCP